MHHNPIDRRRFLLQGGILGASLGSLPAIASSLESAVGETTATASDSKVKPDMSIGTSGEAVRLGVIGVGGRGTYLLETILGFPQADIRAVCDVRPERANEAAELVKERRGKAPETYARDAHDYRRLLERADIDAVLIATDGDLHAGMAVDAMLAGKDVASEVPAAETIEECWKLVRTKEQTGRRYMMLENYFYSQDVMTAFNMARAGAFGQLTQAEGAYIHDCRSLSFEKDGSLTWRGRRKSRMAGNIYPTHALGPIAKILGINAGDRLTSLVSMQSAPVCLHEYAVKQFGPDSAAARQKFTNGDMSVTLVATEKGRHITIHYDSSSPRPASNFVLVQGSRGVFDLRNGAYLDGVSSEHYWAKMEKYEEKYGARLWKEHGAAARATQHAGGDFFTLREFLSMASEKREPFIDVYDAVTWSSLIPLSADSISRKGSSVDIPDFTSGAWKDESRLAKMV